MPPVSLVREVGTLRLGVVQGLAVALLAREVALLRERIVDN